MLLVTLRGKLGTREVGDKGRIRLVIPTTLIAFSIKVALRVFTIYIRYILAYL